MKKIILQNKLMWLAFVILVVAIPLAVFGYNNLKKTDYTLYTGSRLFMVNAYNQDCTIDNNTGINYFIPTKTTGEWNAFKNFMSVKGIDNACCGDGVCNTLDGGCDGCDNDCGTCVTAICGNTICDSSLGETPANCGYDCPGNGCCQRTLAEDCATIFTYNACNMSGTGSCTWDNNTNSCQVKSGWGATCWNLTAEGSCAGHSYEGCVWSAGTPRCSSYCGDGYCNPYTEDWHNCLLDCPIPPSTPYCGDGACNNGETCSSCQSDCGSCFIPNICGNYACEPGNSETCSTCVPDCGACSTDCQGAGCSIYNTMLMCNKHAGCSWAPA